MIQNEHEQKLTLHVDIFVPDHPDRSESPVFRATRKKLIEDNAQARCLVDNEHCDHDHPYELHHAVIEWCDAGGVDWIKVAKACPDFDWKTFDPAHPETFIDSEFNANMILCKKHHTGADHGIHCIPGPMWDMQRFQRNDFTFSPDEAKNG